MTMDSLVYEAIRKHDVEQGRTIEQDAGCRHVLKTLRDSELTP